MIPVFLGAAVALPAPHRSRRACVIGVHRAPGGDQAMSAARACSPTRSGPEAGGGSLIVSIVAGVVLAALLAARRAPLRRQGPARRGASGSRSRSGRCSSSCCSGCVQPPSRRPPSPWRSRWSSAPRLGRCSPADAPDALARRPPTSSSSAACPLLLLIFFTLFGAAQVRHRPAAVLVPRARPRRLQRRRARPRSSAPASSRSTGARPRPPTPSGSRYWQAMRLVIDPAGGAPHDPGHRQPARHAAQGHLARLRHRLRGAAAPQAHRRRVLQQPAPGADGRRR